MSESPTVLGINAFTEQPKKRKWSGATGWRTVRTWKGPNDDTLIRNKEESVRLLGAIDIDTDTGVPATISGSFPDTGGLTADDDQESEDNAQWELIPLEIDKKLSTHPKWNSGNSSTRMAQAKEIVAIDKTIKDGTCDPTTLSTPYNEYATLRILGVETYTRFTFTIRKSYTIAKASAKQMSFPNAMDVISYAAIGVPASCKWLEPSYNEWNTSSYESSFLVWMEKPAQITWDDRTKKYNIVVEWLGMQECPGTLYKGGTAW